MLKKVFDFFVFSSLFIACCAVLMVCQTAVLFKLDFPLSLYAFVFSGSVCSYNFHWYLTPPVVTGSRKINWNLSNRSLHFVLFLAGLCGAAITSLLLVEYWIWLGMTAFFTFLYSAPQINHPLTIWLRKIAVGKTIFLALAWTHVTTLLPVSISETKIEAQHLLFFVNRLFFIYAICIIFDRRDVENDRRLGIKSLITFLSPAGVNILFWLSVAIVSLTSLFLLSWFSLFNTGVLFVPTLIMGLLYEPSRKNNSDYLYYFLLDGLMALSAAILILAKFAR